MARRIRDGDRLRFEVRQLIADGVDAVEIDFLVRDGKVVAAWPIDTPYSHKTKQQLDFRKDSSDN